MVCGTDLDGCGQWQSQRQVKPGEPLPQQLVHHHYHFCHEELSDHPCACGLTFREALCLPQQQELGLPH